MPLAVVLASGMAVAEQVSGLLVAATPVGFAHRYRRVSPSLGHDSAQASRLTSSVAASLPKARLPACC